MPLTSWIRDKIHPYVYNPDDDPLIQERREIVARTDELVRKINETHPATGMTLADMAAYRKREETWNRSLSSVITLRR